MSDANAFEPVLGKIRSPAGRLGRRYSSAILAAAAGTIRLRRRFPASCGRVGRGAGIGRLLGYRPILQRRAIIKARLVRLSKASAGSARAHLRYIQRDGVQRDGSPGKLYGKDAGEIDGREFVDRCSGDRHQFRLIVSAEDGDQYDDLKPLVRRFMAQVAADLGTDLQWVAVDHRDTGHPHTHIILRGKDDRGENLVIARDYISRGMRERLAEIVTQDLGPQQRYEVKRKLRKEVGALRMTSLDRSFEREAGRDRVVRCHHPNAFRHAVRAGRLKKLEALGLAEPLGSSRWKLAPDFRQQLTALGERGDIVRTMQRALTAGRLERPLPDLVIRPVVPAAGLVGRLVERGFSDEMGGRPYLILDGIDGRVHHFTIGSASMEHLPQGAIIRLSPNERSTGRHGAPSARVELLSPVPLERLGAYDGATWLDEGLASQDILPCRKAGFGKKVLEALAARRRWLLARELADEDLSGFTLRPGALDALRRRDLASAADRLSAQLGLEFAPARQGEAVQGRLVRRIDLASGRFALLEDGRQFSLLPWKPMLERHVGEWIEGRSGRGSVSWIVGRSRLPEF